MGNEKVSVSENIVKLVDKKEFKVIILRMEKIRIFFQKRVKYENNFDRGLD